MTGTPRQTEALAFIRQFIAARGYAPTIDEIAAGISLKSKSAVCSLINGLEKRRLIRRLPNRWRGIEIVGDCH